MKRDNENKINHCVTKLPKLVSQTTPYTYKKSNTLGHIWNPSHFYFYRHHQIYFDSYQDHLWSQFCWKFPHDYN